MPSPSDKLARSLESLTALQRCGQVAIRTTDLSRVHRERLLKNGFLKEVMKGWYISAEPNDEFGVSTQWYSAFWGFCAAYLQIRFGSEWHLSAEQSISLHVGNRTIPRQLLVRSPSAKNNLTPLPHDTSILEVVTPVHDASRIVDHDGMRLLSLPVALVNCSPRFFNQNPVDARVALSMISDASEVLGVLLDGGHSTVAGRLAGAFRNIGRERIADQIAMTMRRADYVVREIDPFKFPAPVILPTREISPYVNRLRLMWEEMRSPIIERFPPTPGRSSDFELYFKHVDEIYVTDSYHSLSIEGYRVSRELIKRVRSGEWRPDAYEHDAEFQQALAARGYWRAYQAVRSSLSRVLRGENAGTVAGIDHATWYGEMFAPSVTAGLVAAHDLAGYRNGPVFIRGSQHIPPGPKSVRELMPILFELLRDEAEAGVRIVLGHFVFVYIHPYVDGNGRMGRFLMNLMLAAGGYPWTVVPVESRDSYMAALEEASVRQNIAPFADFLARLVESGH